MNQLDAARASLRALVKHVYETAGPLAGITYSELAYRIDRLNKHGEAHPRMGKALGIMGHLLEDVESAPAWTDPIPHIQSLVVNKTGRLGGLPDDGISEFWSSYPELPKEEKWNRVQVEYQDIKSFGSRWNDVLRALDLAQVPVGNTAGNERRRIRGFGRGGESPQHKALKEFVAQNPTLVGASAEDQVCLEYALPSLDMLDVLFKGRTRWIAVEVKSKVSDNMPSDYERGIYQCVKYRSILEAMQKDPAYQLPSEVQVVLALESELPSPHQRLAKETNANVIQRIRHNS